MPERLLSRSPALAGGSVPQVMSAITFATAQLLRVVPRRTVGRAIGHLADRPWHPLVGRAVVAAYSRLYRVSFDDCVQTSGWPSFDAFFTRELRREARPIPGDPRLFVSPADGVIDSLGAIEPGCTYRIKGRSYAVDELVGDPVEARRYEGGKGFVVYLSPRDYHRVHAPVDGVVSRIRSLPGDYFPVNAIGVRHIDRLFVRNRRVAIAIDSAEFGRTTVVMVAAIVVGRITVSGLDAHDVPLGDHTPGLRVSRGDEIGQFHLGSTAVVLFEPGAIAEWAVREGPVRVGQPIARAAIGPKGEP